MKKKDMLLARSTSAFYSALQFLLIYGFLDQDLATYFAFALICVGFIPIFDFTLSVNSSSFRNEVNGSSAFVVNLIIALCIIAIFSETLVIFFSNLILVGEVHSRLSIPFFYATGLTIVINVALPLFFKCGSIYSSAVKLMALADVGAMVSGAVALAIFGSFEVALVIAAFIRLILCLSALFWVGGFSTGPAIFAALSWWGSQVFARRRFISTQFLSVLAGASLFSFPGAFLMSVGTEEGFVQYAFAVSITNIIVAFLSSYYSLQTELLLSVSADTSLTARLKSSSKLVIRVFLLIVPVCFFVICAIFAASYLFSELVQVEAFSHFDLPLTVIVLCSGLFNLCSQIVAMGQKLRGFDNFAFSALLFGLISALLIIYISRSPVEVAVITVLISVVNFGVGAIFRRRRF